jgi:hypothetical protein
MFVFFRKRFLGFLRLIKDKIFRIFRKPKKNQESENIVEKRNIELIQSLEK